MDRSSLPAEAFLQPYPHTMRGIAEALREVVRSTLPDAVERVRPGWRLIGYDVPIERRLRYVAYIAPEDQHVHLGFEHGVHLWDPRGLLLGAGITRQVRWLTYRSLDELDREVASGFLLEAVRVAGLPASLRDLTPAPGPLP